MREAFVRARCGSASRSHGPSVAAVVAFAIVLAACTAADRSSAPRSHVAADYFPLTPGSRWTYQVEDFAFGWKLERRTTLRRRPIPALGRVGAILEESYSPSSDPVLRAPVQPIAYFWEGGYLHAIHVTEQDRELTPIDGFADLLVLPEAVRPGVTWNGAVPRKRDLGFAVEETRRVRMMNGAVRVPAGAFGRCIRVDSTVSHRSHTGTVEVSLHYSDWYAPGVGLVRSIMWHDRQRDHARVRIELLEFRIPGSSHASR